MEKHNKEENHEKQELQMAAQPVSCNCPDHCNGGWPAAHRRSGHGTGSGQGYRGAVHQ